MLSVLNLFRDVFLLRFVRWLIISILPAIDVLVSPVDTVICGSVCVYRCCCRRDLDNDIDNAARVLYRSNFC